MNFLYGASKITTKIKIKFRFSGTSKLLKHLEKTILKNVFPEKKTVATKPKNISRQLLGKMFLNRNCNRLK